MILSLAAFAALAASCGASVHPDTLAAVARAESGFNTLAIGDNTARRSHAPASVEAAVALATALLRDGRSLDLGLMQVNSANLARLGMTVADAFDPCRSIAAGARVLVDGFRRPGEGEDAQPAVLRALSHYNTGHPQRGFGNGYVTRVQAAAEQVVPALRLRAGQGAQPGAGEAAERPAPPAWDVYGQARHRRQAVGPSRVPAGDVPPAAVQLQAPVREARDAR